jgi:hypothetical protein
MTSLDPGYCRIVAGSRDAMTSGHRDGDYTPISSFLISSWSIFCTLLLAT